MACRPADIDETPKRGELPRALREPAGRPRQGRSGLLEIVENG